jgi:adenylate cyclase class IV
MKEVELRSFVTPAQAEAVLAQVSSAGFTQISDERQITYYLDIPSDTRVQISTHSGKVWQKLGKMHDTSRTEFNAPMSRESAENMLEIFKNMGLGIKVAWLRHRREFTRGGLSLTVDNTVGYGWIVEVELQSAADDTAPVVEELRGELKKLGLAASPKETFDTAYKSYVANWKTLTAGQLEGFLGDKVAAK